MENGSLFPNSNVSSEPIGQTATHSDDAHRSDVSCPPDSEVTEAQGQRMFVCFLTPVGSPPARPRSFIIKPLCFGVKGKGSR